MVIINDILDISKIESGKFEIDNHFFDFRKSVKTAIGLLEARAQEKSIDLVCDLDSSVPNAIYSDSTRIRQVLLNLVGNAIKFTNSGSVILKVSYLQTNNGLHKIYFEVEDTGMGIPNNKLKDIFNPFSLRPTLYNKKLWWYWFGIAHFKIPCRTSRWKYDR